jgi:hypothetical protein
MGDYEGYGGEQTGGDSAKAMGIYIRARLSYDGYKDAEDLKQDLDDIGEKAGNTEKDMARASMASYRTAMNYRILAMSTMSAVTSLAMLAGANQQQVKVLQAVNAILMITITLYTILAIVSGGGSMAAGGGIRAGAMGMKGIAGLFGAMGGIMHQGGYGSDKLALIQSNERVIPSNRIMTNYGGNISIGTMVLQGGSGKDLARDFTEQLESYKQRGTMGPEWG